MFSHSKGKDLKGKRGRKKKEGGGEDNSDEK